MSWEDIVKEALSIVFSLVITAVLIVIAWLAMWHLIFSKMRFVREIMFPDSNEKQADPQRKAELRSKREKKQRKDI